MLQDNKHEELLKSSVLCVDLRIIDNLEYELLSDLICLESLSLLSEHISGKLVEEQHCSKSTISITRPSWVLFRYVVIIVSLEELHHLLVLRFVCEELLLKHGFTGT